jgi:hypothetical protein
MAVYLLLMTTRGAPKYDYSSPRGEKTLDEVFARFEATPLERGDIARIASEHQMPAPAVSDW